MNNKIYKKIAKKYGVSVEEVKRDMQACIDEAYKNPTDYAKQIKGNGEKPSVEEFIDSIARKVKE